MANNMSDLVFNPETGLFENITDPTAHIVGRKKPRRPPKPIDPEKALYKPRIIRFTRNGELRPTPGTTINLMWDAEPAKSVHIIFPDGAKFQFPPHSNCCFVTPGKECKITLIATNRRFRTQQTMTIKPRLTLADRLRNILHRK